MKRVALALFLSIVAMAAARGASLKIVSPNGGETLVIGNPAAIQWSATGISEKVRLVLFKGGKKVGVIADELNATPSSYSWTAGQYAGGTAAVGTDYQVRIRTLSDSYSDLSDEAFSLVESASGLAIKPVVKRMECGPDANFFPIRVSAPVEGGTYPAGKPLIVTWDKEIGFGGYLRLHFLNEDGEVLETKYPIVNTGYYDVWVPDPKYTWPGARYRIRLTMQSASNPRHAAGQSGLFSITVPEATQ